MAKFTTKFLEFNYTAGLNGNDLRREYFVVEAGLRNSNGNVLIVSATIYDGFKRPNNKSTYKSPVFEAV